MYSGSHQNLQSGTPLFPMLSPIHRFNTYLYLLSYRLNWHPYPKCGGGKLLCCSMHNNSWTNHKILLHVFYRYIWYSSCLPKLFNTSLHFLQLDKTYDDLKQKACGMVSSDCIEFPNEQFGDMCKCPGCVLNGTCPFKANTGYNLSVPVPLQASFPKVRYVYF